MNSTYLDSLEYSWSAEVLLKNNQIINIWYTAWPMTKCIVKSVISVSSDYPKFKII